jgi:hypothetical protein
VCLGHHALAVTHTHVATSARVTAASKSHVHSSVVVTAKDRTQAATQAYRGVYVALLVWHEIRRCLLQSYHHAIGFSFPDPLGFKELGSALPLIASLHKELPYSPQEERHVMVSSGDQPLIVSMDNWFIWDPGGRATIVRDDSPARRSVLQHSWTLGISISQDVKGLFLSRYLA